MAPLNRRHLRIMEIAGEGLAAFAIIGEDRRQIIGDVRDAADVVSFPAWSGHLSAPY